MTALGLLELCGVLTTPGVHSMLCVTAKPGVLTALQRPALQALTRALCACKSPATAGTDVLVLLVSAPAPVSEFPFSYSCRASVVLPEAPPVVVNTSFLLPSQWPPLRFPRKARVAQSVILSDRIVDSLCVLTTFEYGWSADFERIMKTQACSPCVRMSRTFF